MKVHEFACPHCTATVKSAAGVDVGRNVPCPKCKKRFDVPGPAAEADDIEVVEDVEEVEEAPKPRKKPALAAKPAAAVAATREKPRKPARRPADEEDDDEEDRPRKKTGFSVVRIIVLTLLLAVMGVLGTMLYFKWQSEKDLNAGKNPDSTNLVYEAPSQTEKETYLREQRLRQWTNTQISKLQGQWETPLPAGAWKEQPEIRRLAVWFKPGSQFEAMGSSPTNPLAAWGTHASWELKAKTETQADLVLKTFPELTDRANFIKPPSDTLAIEFQANDKLMIQWRDQRLVLDRMPAEPTPTKTIPKTGPPDDFQKAMLAAKLSPRLYGRWAIDVENSWPQMPKASRLELVYKPNGTFTFTISSKGGAPIVSTGRWRLKAINEREAEIELTGDTSLAGLFNAPSDKIKVEFQKGNVIEHGSRNFKLKMTWAPV